jgi:catalase
MNISMRKIRRTAAGFALVTVAVFLAGAAARVKGQGAEGNDLSQQIFDTMLKVPGTKPGNRPVHAKGIVVQGTFVPSKDAASFSKAAHFQGPSVPVTVRFSDGAPDPSIPDNSPEAGARGMAIRFMLPGGGKTDIVAISHNGFAVGTGTEFLELQQAIVATDPSKPHPWPIERFLMMHPQAMKFVTEIKVTPASFATEAFFANNAFVFVNKNGVKQPGRYQILPAAGQRNLSEAEAKKQPPDFLVQDLKTRLAKGPITYRLVVQIPNADDQTKDSSVVWPNDRDTVNVGSIRITSVVPDNSEMVKTLAYDPVNLTDGIELSDDPLPALRSKVYALSVQHRLQQQQVDSSR